MMKKEVAVALLDALNLDESLVDACIRRLLSKVARSSSKDEASEAQLRACLYLLQYKLELNKREEIDIDNTGELALLTELFISPSELNASFVAPLLTACLCLCPTHLCSSAEHLLQQFFSELDECGDDKRVGNTVIYIDAVLDAVIEVKIRISLLFVDLSSIIQRIIHSHDKNTVNQFLSSTVPKLIQATDSYDTLDRIWTALESEKDTGLALSVISALSDYYLPVPENEEIVKYKSDLYRSPNFWQLILNGLQSDEVFNRKLSIYLFKRALESVAHSAEPCTIHLANDNSPIFTWTPQQKKHIEKIWEQYFTLLESLDEKQSNIVIPSLPLVEKVQGVGWRWMSCIWRLAFKHDSEAVVRQCVEYRLCMDVENVEAATQLLTVINNLSMFDESTGGSTLVSNLLSCCSNIVNLINIFKAFSTINWTAVPLFHVTQIFSLLTFDRQLTDLLSREEVTEIIVKSLSMPVNNVVLRYAISCNVLQFLLNNCKGLDKLQLASIIAKLPNGVITCNQKALAIWIKDNFKVEDNEKKIFWKFAGEQHNLVDLTLIYLESFSDEKTLYDAIIQSKCQKLLISLCDIKNFTCEDENIQDSLYLSILANKIYHPPKELSEFMISFLLCSENFMAEIDNIDIKQVDWILQIYQKMFTSALLKNKELLDTKIQSENFIQFLLTANSFSQKYFTIKILVFLSRYLEESLNEDQILNLFSCNISSIGGKEANALNEAFCELLANTLSHKKSIDLLCNPMIINKTFEIINNMLNCGGYGCLRWILNIFKVILPTVHEGECFNVQDLLLRCWKEINELKSNEQYKPCIKEFIAIITHVDFLKDESNNETITWYFTQILENAATSNIALYYLSNELCTRGTSKDFPINATCVEVMITELLLFSEVPRRDQRITDTAVKMVYDQKEKFGLTEFVMDQYHFNSEIQANAINLCSHFCENFHSLQVFAKISHLTTVKVNELFKNKQRYHGDSKAHRTLLAAVQSLTLLIYYSDSYGCPTSNMVNVKELRMWCWKMLQKLPHQPSVRILLELNVAISIFKDILLHDEDARKNILEEIITDPNFSTLPITSCLMIVYLLIKKCLRRMKADTYKNECVKYLLDYLLSHSMGPTYATRLLAQHLSFKTHHFLQENEPKSSICNEYQITIKLIENTLLQCANDKSYEKLRNNYFINEYDLDDLFFVDFIYTFIPEYTGVAANEVSLQHYICQNFSHNQQKELGQRRKLVQEKYLQKHAIKPINSDGEIESSTIQKKYIPWRDMTDVALLPSHSRKLGSGVASELVVVASLLEKAPNLGGLARSSEVFAVRSYVVECARRLQEPAAQGLSVSAERWLDVQEVRRGAPLRQYLQEMRLAGYSVVAAEQTSASQPLHTFSFPHKTVLLLGHEKRGVEGPLLALVDTCIEIPQLGQVRSLNVHVAASLCIWEYAKQHLFHTK